MHSLPRLLLVSLFAASLSFACQSTPADSTAIQAAQVAPGAVIVHATIGGVT